MELAQIVNNHIILHLRNANAQKINLIYQQIQFVYRVALGIKTLKNALLALIIKFIINQLINVSVHLKHPILIHILHVFFVIVKIGVYN